MAESQSASDLAERHATTTNDTFETAISHANRRSRWGTTPFPIPTATMSLAEESTLCAAGGLGAAVTATSPIASVDQKTRQVETEGWLIYDL